MQKRSVLLIALLATLLSTAFAPVAQSEKYELFIHNDTEDGVSITLEGPKVFKFDVAPGKFEKTVNEGTYDYTIEVDDCDITLEGTITVEDDDQELIIPPCEDFVVEPKFIVNNHIDEAIVLELFGPEEYSLNLKLGKNKFDAIRAGFYSYSYETCDGTIFTGSLRVTKNGKSQFTIKNCERLIFEDFSKPNPVSLRLANHYSIPLDVTLIGPTTYFLTANPGLNRVDVISGSYRFIFSAYNERIEGSFLVRKNSTTRIVLSPAFIEKRNEGNRFALE